MNVSTIPDAAVIANVDPNERNQALAAARREATQNALAEAEASDARRAERLQNARAAIQHALGVDTRISVVRNDAAATFVYRAIDVDTGEIVREWPPAEFAQFLENSGAQTDTLVEAGAIVDEHI